MKVLQFTCMLLLSFSAIARQPAVLPSRGLSTAKYDANLPKSEKFSGYSFAQRPVKNSQVVINNIESLSKKGPASISIYLTIFALLFPFALWFINNKSLKDENDLINKEIADSHKDTVNSDTENLSNIIELGQSGPSRPSESNDLEDRDNDDNQKKAS